MTLIIDIDHYNRLHFRFFSALAGNWFFLHTIQVTTLCNEPFCLLNLLCVWIIQKKKNSYDNISC